MGAGVSTSTSSSGTRHPPTPTLSATYRQTSKSKVKHQHEGDRKHVSPLHTVSNNNNNNNNSGSSGHNKATEDHHGGYGGGGAPGSTATGATLTPASVYNKKLHNPSNISNSTRSNGSSSGSSSHHLHRDDAVGILDAMILASTESNNNIIENLATSIDTRADDGPLHLPRPHNHHHHSHPDAANVEGGGPQPQGKTLQHQSSDATDETQNMSASMSTRSLTVPTLANAKAGTWRLLCASVHTAQTPLRTYSSCAALSQSISAILDTDYGIVGAEEEEEEKKS